MNQTDFSETHLAALFEVFFHDARNVLGQKRMQIDFVFDRKNNRLTKGGILWIFFVFVQ